MNRVSAEEMGAMRQKEADMQVSRWGNSLAIRLPAAVVDALGIKEGDEIQVVVAGEKQFALQKKPGADEWLSRLRKYRGRLPEDFLLDREEENERKDVLSGQ